MKGVPEAPRCGFSNAVCQILRMHDVTFKSFDVLSDEELRSGFVFLQSFNFLILFVNMSCIRWPIVV